MGRQIRARRKEGDTKITNYFLPAESGEKRKFREFTSGEEGMEIENVKRMRMNQEMRKYEKKRMETEKISEKDEEFSTLQTQTDQGEKSKVKTWDFLGILLNKKNSNFGAFLGN